MYFKQIQAIADLLKTLTRRVAKDNEEARYAPDGSIEAVYTVLADGRKRLKWEVGREYSTSPGRGEHGAWWKPETREVKQPTESLGLYRVDSVGGVADGWRPLRRRLLEIRREPLREISVDDAIAEGVVCRGCHGNGYYLTGGGDWTGPYEEKCVCDPIGDYRALWESINGRDSWDKCGDVWVLRFEVVRA